MHMSWDWRWLRQFDWLMLLLLLGLSGFGLIMIYSAASPKFPGEVDGFLLKQALAILIGLGMTVLIIWFDYTEFARFERVLYGLMCLLLVAVHFIGETRLGAQRWIAIGGFQLQPSEPAKFLFILTLASFLSRREGKLQTWWELLPPAIFLGVPFVLIAAQPDLGTGLVFIAIFFSMLYMAGAPGRKLLLVLVTGLTLAIAVVWAEVHFETYYPLQKYQIDRLTCFLQNDDPTGDCYQVTQAKIAIGSGGFEGKGITQGTQSRLGYLPEQHTDMIFAIIGEETGFIGGMAVLLSFFFLFMRIYRTAMHAKDTYGRLLATGVVAMLSFHTMENIGMNMGVMPIAGVPLPFLSYGPSAMVTVLMACALVFSVGVRQREINF
jgi:rod shape determining protein RodA